MDRICVLIVDDHAIVRKGLKQLLLEEFPSVSVEEAGDAESAVKKVIVKKPHVVICDLNMPGRNGIDALKQIKNISPDVPVLIMSMYPEDQYALRVLKSGASGYLNKESIHDELIRAIQTVLLGRKFITPSVTARIIDAFETDGNSSFLSHESLSDREFEIFRLLALGKTVSEIAKQLSLSSSTVSTYRSRVLEKLNLRSNSDLIRYALEKKLI
jgi:DNA-binding NarL/FixJ family response regulator